MDWYMWIVLIIGFILLWELIFFIITYVRAKISKHNDIYKTTTSVLDKIISLFIALTISTITYLSIKFFNIASQIFIGIGIILGSALAIILACLLIYLFFKYNAMFGKWIWNNVRGKRGN